MENISNKKIREKFLFHERNKKDPLELFERIKR
jgi:hypothetical protein